MPRTPAPLTVALSDNMAGVSEYYDIEWTVLKDHVVIAAFKEEAAARAFVALPALIAVLREDSCLSCGAEPGCNIDCALCAALAQADGPAPKEE